ncbi:hypothetical protein PSTT_15178, partial [Puccinia striiformis]
PHPVRITGSPFKTAPLSQENLSAHTQHPPLLSQSVINWLSSTLRLHSKPHANNMSNPQHHNNEQEFTNDKRFTQLVKLDQPNIPSQFSLSQLNEYFPSPAPSSLSPCPDVNPPMSCLVLPGHSAPPPPVLSSNCIQTNRSTRIVIKLPIEYSVWVHDALPITRRAAGAGAGRPPAKWVKLSSKLPLDTLTNFGWGLAKHQIIKVIGLTHPYFDCELMIADGQHLLTWYRVITSHAIYGVGKRFTIVSKVDWLGFATATEAAYPTKPCLIKIIQPDPRVVAGNQAQVSEGNKILIFINGSAQEQAPLEQTQSRFAANPNAVVTTTGRDQAVRLRDHHIALQAKRNTPSQEGEFAMHLLLDGHRVLWARACALEVNQEGVTLDIPPSTDLFPAIPSKCKAAPALLLDSPASHTFQGANTNPVASLIWTAQAPKSYVDLTRILCTLSSIGKNLFDVSSCRPPGSVGVVDDNPIDPLPSPEISFVSSPCSTTGCASNQAQNITPLNLSKLTKFHLTNNSPVHIALHPQLPSRPTAHEARHVLTMEAFPEWCAIMPKDFKTCSLIDKDISTWTYFWGCTAADLVALGFKAGLACLIVEGIVSIKQSIPEE